MTRTKALVGAILVGIIAAGCLIKGPEPVPEYYSNIRIFPESNSRPPYSLEPAPEGRIYQFWFLDYGYSPTESTITLLGVVPLTRFQWNSEYYFAVSDSGETLGITTDRGLELGQNIFDHTALALSVEPLVDAHPDSIDGPILLVGELSVFARANQSLQMVVPIDTFGTNCGYMIAAPSYMKNLPGHCWRDAVEGMGIWFGAPTVADRELSDTVALCMADLCPPGAARNTCRENACGPDTGQAYGTHFGMKFVQGKKNLRGPGYHLWIFPSEPSQSFCNFDTIFANQEPDLRIRDSVPEHLGGNVGPQMPLGEDPILRNGETVGYMYFRSDTTGLVDTCFLRIDIPESTHCTSDSFQYAPFNDTSVIVRTFLSTWAETTYTSTLTKLAQPPEFIGGSNFLAQFLGLEYEAWVVIDSSNGAIKPIPLGRFLKTNQLDDDNSHFNVQDLSPSFHYPGEDLLHAINRPGLPSSNLDLLSLLDRSRVKVWITLEPIRNDWAPDEPNRQLILYSGDLFPDTSLALFQEACALRGAGGVAAPPVYMRPLKCQEVSASTSALNEGHNFPKMRVEIRHPLK